MKLCNHRGRAGVSAFLIAGLASVFLVSGGVAAHEPDKPYRVDCEQTDEEGRRFCETDRGTYVGWRTYHAACHVCHGQDGVGSSFAPNLVERLKHIDETRFRTAVNEGVSGQMGVMPGFGQNPNVRNFVDELYSYLLARSDGVLRPGRPKWTE